MPTVRLGNVSRPLVIPLIAGGIVGAVLGPIVASFFSAEAIRVAVEVLIIVSAILLLVSLPLKQMQVSRPDGDVPTARVGVIGTASGMASGISGAGWGPMGVTLLILSRIEPRVAVGSSVFGRIFMAAAAVLSAVMVLALTPGLYDEVDPTWMLVPSHPGGVAGGDAAGCHPGLAPGPHAHVGDHRRGVHLTRHCRAHQPPGVGAAAPRQPLKSYTEPSVTAASASLGLGRGGAVGQQVQE